MEISKNPNSYTYSPTMTSDSDKKKNNGVVETVAVGSVVTAATTGNRAMKAVKGLAPGAKAAGKGRFLAGITEFLTQSKMVGPILKNKAVKAATGIIGGTAAIAASAVSIADMVNTGFLATQQYGSGTLGQNFNKNG